MLKYATTALALATAAFAQSSNTCSGTSTIQNAGDATAIGGCSTFTGAIVLATGTSGNIDFGSLQSISGDLVVNNVTALTGLSGSQLQSVSGQLELVSVTILNSLAFPRLTSVGNLLFDHLPGLGSLNFGTEGLTQASQIQISDTGLSTLSSISVDSLELLSITENRELNNINLNVVNIDGLLNIAGNGNDLSINFPMLEGAMNVTVLNVSSASFPALQYTNETLSFYGNSFKTLDLSNMTMVGNALTLQGNSQLNNLTANGITSIGGGLNIINNGALDLITGFQNLATVDGAINMGGNFTSVELPALKLVKGDFTLVSSANIQSNCSTFQGEAGPDSTIRGAFSCHSQTTTGGSGGSSSSGGSGSGSGQKSGASALTLNSGSALALAGVVAAVFTLL